LKPGEKRLGLCKVKGNNYVSYGKTYNLEGTSRDDMVKVYGLDQKLGDDYWGYGSYRQFQLLDREGK
jgi:hypothetical protein